MSYNDSDGTVVSAQDYYPFGDIIPQRSYNNSDPNDRFKFTEKELDKETKYHYFGARFYDSFLGRWHSVDPMADKYHGWSPYTYGLDNPVMLVDPNGLSTIATHKYRPKSEDSDRGYDIIEVETRESAYVGDEVVHQKTTVTVIVDQKGDVVSCTKKVETTPQAQINAWPFSKVETTSHTDEISRNELSAYINDYVDEIAQHKRDNDGRSLIQDLAISNSEFNEKAGDILTPIERISGVGGVLLLVARTNPITGGILTIAGVSAAATKYIISEQNPSDPNDIIITWKVRR